MQIIFAIDFQTNLIRPSSHFISASVSRINRIQKTYQTIWNSSEKTDELFGKRKTKPLDAIDLRIKTPKNAKKNTFDLSRWHTTKATLRAQGLLVMSTGSNHGHLILHRNRITKGITSKPWYWIYLHFKWQTVDLLILSWIPTLDFPLVLPWAGVRKTKHFDRW